MLVESFGYAQDKLKSKPIKKKCLTKKDSHFHGKYI